MALKGFPTIWVDNTADSLLNIVVKYCVKNPKVLCTYDFSLKGYVLREGILLPREICEQMLLACKDEVLGTHVHSFINIFRDTQSTRLECLDLCNSIINSKDLETITRHPFVEINTGNCRNLTLHDINSIFKGGKSVTTIDLGSNDHIYNREEFEVDPLNDVHMENTEMGLFQRHEGTKASEEETIINLPNLRSFSLHCSKEEELNLTVSNILSKASYLTHLDLTACELPSTFCSVISMKHLESLVLCDVMNGKEMIDTICTISTLRYLDISNTSDTPCVFHNPSQILRNIVDSLPVLQYLDISGTNLAGNRTLERNVEETHCFEGTMTDILGLSGRVNKPLEFLGLFNTAHEACYRHHIPAKQIAGDANEAQVLISGQVYCSRERSIQKVLNDLYQIFRVSTCTNMKLAVDIIIEAMMRHVKKKNIQVSGSASLFYIVKSNYKRLFNIKIRRKIITVLIDGMFAHSSDITMVRNGCLTLIHFKIPEDVFFIYERLTSLLLLIISQDNQDDFVQRITVYLLNSLACQVDGIEKKMVGDRGAIAIMLSLIEKRLNRTVCDEVMETAWSTMWNVTDETPINCERFLKGKGMDLFLKCLKAFPQKPELLRNMMGLLGNVAEVKELRSYLMKDEYLSVFSELLGNESDGIEVSYNAAGILAHIASDGPDVWHTHHIKTVKREFVLKEIVNAINKWSIVTKRNINYRSFKPILRLVTTEPDEARYWAVWALANLTTVYPKKYCSLLREEGGVELLDQLTSNGSVLQNIIHQLAEISEKNTVEFEIKVKEGRINEFDNDPDTYEI